MLVLESLFGNEVIGIGVYIHELCFVGEQFSENKDDFLHRPELSLFFDFRINRFTFFSLFTFNLQELINNFN